MKIGVLGLHGRMGKMVAVCLQELRWDILELSFDKNILAKQLAQVDGVIEFSSPDAVDMLLDVATIPCVLASTGISDALKEKIINKSKVFPVFYSANYAIGLNKLLFFLKKMQLDGSQAEIFETHHVHKKDAPSGTAILLKNELQITAPIISQREGEVFGEHEIHYHLDGESLMFKHEAKTRKIFAIGACEALKFLISKGPGLYSMKDLLEVFGGSS